MALAAFAVRSGEETRQVQMVCVDDLVPGDDELRRIERLVDWEHIRATARPFYRPGGAGRSGIDPAVLVKLALVLAWRGLPSMRATLKVAAADMSIRRFLGFGLTERLPDHSTFSHAQTKRFADSSSSSSSSRRCSGSAPTRGWSVVAGWSLTVRISRLTRP
ncbi:MAG: transposase [Actinobacteria bacterium]|nr:transposase [Actinomycetota bacterium]